MPAETDRHLSLDAIRGVAVMGILVANLPAFALPGAAYFAPLAAGGTAPADIAVWLVNLILVEGKMRALFSFLFGASMLLVIDRAAAAGDDPAMVHSMRMATLFAIGLVHLYLVWWGDILTHYALCGAIAYPFTRLRPRALILCGLALTAVGTLLAAGALVALAEGGAPAVALRIALDGVFGVPPQAILTAEIAANRGGWVAATTWRWHHATDPLTALWVVGPDTIGAMLLGMAGLRSGFLTGAWSRDRYRRWAIVCLGIALPAYAGLGVATMRHGFALEWVYGVSMVASAPLRILGAVGDAALVMLLLRPGGALTTRIAAAGRVAFTNYLATSLVMTFVFGWGLARFGQWSRAELYLLAPVAWAVMLAWSAPWLRRYRYGPLEWLWRSLARLRWQPLRRDQ